MKRGISVLVLAAIMALAGCQTTPEAEVVRAKNGQALLEKASAETEGTLAERVDAPERYQGAASNAEGTLQVTIDGAVTVPEAERVPIYRVTPGAFTQEQADTLMAELVRTTLYAPSREMTKDEIMERLLQAKRELADSTEEEKDAVLYTVDENGEESAVRWEESMRGLIDSLAREYETAPETEQMTPVSGRFEPDDGGGESIEGQGSSQDIGFEKLWISNDTEAGSCWARYHRGQADNSFSWNYEDPETIRIFHPDFDPRSIPDIAVTKEEAVATGTALADKLGVPGLTLWSVGKQYDEGWEEVGRPAPCCWTLRFIRTVGGVPVTYASNRMMDAQNGDSYASPWPYEALTMYIDDGGVVGLDWQSPYSVGEELTEDAALLPFSEIMDIFEKMYVVANDGRTMDVTVNDIRLGYVRVLRQDREGEAMLVPAWDFFGTTVNREWDEPYNDTIPGWSLLTINAVDGTIIDRGRGF